MNLLVKVVVDSPFFCFNLKSCVYQFCFFSSVTYFASASSEKSSAFQYLVSGKSSNQNFAFPFRYLPINLALRLFDQLLISDASSNFFKKSKGSSSTFPYNSSGLTSFCDKPASLNASANCFASISINFLIF